MGASNKQVFRLHDIVTEEVSLVDRAANKRQFLLTKRDSMGQVTPNGAGGFETANTPPEPSTLRVTKGVREPLLAMLAKSIETLTGLANQFNAAEEVESVEPAEAATLTQTLKSMRLAGAQLFLPSVEALQADRAEIGKAVGAAMQKLTEVASMLGVDGGDHDMKYRVQDALYTLCSVAYSEPVLEAMGLVVSTGTAKNADPSDPAPKSDTAETTTDAEPVKVEPAETKPDATEPEPEPSEAAKALKPLLSEIDQEISVTKSSTPSPQHQKLVALGVKLKKHAMDLEARERQLVIREKALNAPRVVPSNATAEVNGDAPTSANKVIWPLDMNRELPAEDRF